VYSRRLVELAHDLDFQVMAWTIDQAAAISRLLDEGGRLVTIAQVSTDP
jgi:hypothetical protein